MSIYPRIKRLLRIIECLKKSGLEIKDIKQFFIWVSEGSSSYEKRKELFETRKSAVETEIQELQKTLSLLKFISPANREFSFTQ